MGDYVYNQAGFGFKHRIDNREEYFKVRGLGYTDVSLESAMKIWATAPSRKPLASLGTMLPRLATEVERTEETKAGMSVLVVGLYPIKVEPDIKNIGRDNGNKEMGQSIPKDTKDITDNVHVDDCYRVTINCSEISTANIGVMLERESQTDWQSPIK